ncbi:MAG: PHP domain-containing protein [Synergistetes bacterium]|nr:PHP domain-containing protein [Synergistota bacterium]
MWCGVDLHIHTVLSACADWEMTPKNIVKRAKEMDIKIIAITDHNTAKNVKACIKVGRKEGILVIPGIEVQTKEEVHMVALFPSEENVEGFERWLKDRLPRAKNDEGLFGIQVVVDEEDNVIEIDERLLQVSAKVSVEDVALKAKECGGIAYPAHMDREYGGIISVLGFIPPDLPFKVGEITYHADLTSLLRKHPELRDYVILVSSDAHFLSSIKGARTAVDLVEISPASLIKAIQDKRRVKTCLN